MTHKTYLILFLFLIQFQINNATFEEEYPGTIICQNDNVQIESLHSSVEKLKILSIIRSKNCTHIQGSIYILGITKLESKERELNFDSIEEIDGHLIIEGNDLEKITFKNLRIIRGANSIKRNLIDKGHTDFSLVVSGNAHLVDLDFRSLRSINAHNVIFDSNPKMKYLPHSIKWNELFTDPKAQILFSPTVTKDLILRDKCSDQCKLWANFTQVFCWGPSANQCQQQTLCGSKYSSECTTCRYINGEEQGCCNDQCLGGCNGGGASKCTACKNMLNEKKCVELCRGPYSGGIGGTITNKEFRYHAGFFCSKQCPAMMLPENTGCVHKCSEGYFKNKSNHCIKCYGNMCTNDHLPCNLFKIAGHTDGANDFYLRAQDLVQLKNCKKILGYIVLTEDSFVKHNITVEMLYENLNKLQELEGGFSYFKDNHLKNLTFLRNLLRFRAAYLHSDIPNLPSYHKFAISETELEFLGLKSLKEINGPFRFFKNQKLCYMNIPVNELFKNVKNFYYIPSNCTDKICHKDCSEKGCWGPGNKLCYECRKYDAAGTCVSDCSQKKGFYNPINSSLLSNQKCLRCHPECLNTCVGPNPNQCIKGCKNKRENGTCVASCSKNFYPPLNDSKACLPCHPNCSEYNSTICTGPSSVPGIGGCNKCERILLSRKADIVSCVKTCHEGTYAFPNDRPDISRFYPVTGFTCLPCPELCSKCKGKSPKNDECEVCKGVWHKNTCRLRCPRDESYGTKIIDSISYCKTCHSSCKGCYGSTIFNCTRCKNKKIYLDKKKFYCNDTCPPLKSVEEIEKGSGDIVCLSLWESKAKLEETKRTHITVGVVVTMLILVIIVIVTIVVYLKRKAIAERIETELKARYSNLTEPNSKDEDLLSKPPNMGRLMIVSKEDLIFEDESKPLGFGAFGYVYKGKWKIPKNEETLLKKASGDFYLPVAIKVIKNMGNEEIESVMQEAKMMASVSHMHCLRFIGVCLSYEKPCLISAYVKEGSLDKFLIRNKNKITSLIMLSWSEQIADGMLYLTKRNIIHRDLAARNVLVSRLECVQITDFGLSKMLESTKDKEIIIKTGKVPIRWLAIETLTDGKYSHETDVWAYGVTLWEIFTFGKVPYEDQATHDIFDFVLKGGRLSQPDICSLDVYIIMVNCWLESPNLRPDFQNLMQTFTDYCKNPGRYLSIQGDPYEIPSPHSIEMTNFNNHYGEDQFNFPSMTAETMLPLLNGRDSIDRDVKDFTDNNEIDESLLSSTDKEPLPTRSMNRTSNIFKLFQDNKQSQNPQNLNTRNNNTNNNNTPRLVSLASQEEPTFRNQPLITDDDPRYVADPTEKSIKMRQQLPLQSQFLQETPRFHSNISRENHTPFNNVSASQSPQISQISDDYLEPNAPGSKNTSLVDTGDPEGYLEPINPSNKSSLLNQDDYVVPSLTNTPRESMLNSKPPRNSNAFKQSKQYISMDDGNPHFSNSIDDDDGYLEPEPKSRLLNSSNR
uniref:receptor protein-tyrosine kinase n=1 Tax=Schmidtea mediterranea TaxID=79327 RepID=A0A1B1ACY5_SCHMD|nr:epidermal growth factor receptor Smed-egfr-4 [Schmidtea mediterranea]